MVTFNVDSLDFVDDEELRTGSDADFATRFDSANNRLEIEDLTNATVGHVPQNFGSDLVGGKFAETVAEGKALADDGSVYDTIQHAVNNASSWVKVGPGDFRETVTIGTAGLTLIGSGDRTRIRRANNNIIKIAAANVKIEDFNLANSGDSFSVIQTLTGADTGAITNVSITRSTDEGVRIDHGGGWLIKELQIEDTTSQGVQISGGRGGNVISNVKVTNSNKGLFINRDDNVIANCILNNIDNQGIRSQGGDDSIIITNVIDNVETGIAITNQGKNNLIANNRVKNAGTGIDVTNANETVLDANLTT